jgi:membrane-associated phospholipid phosphatase
MNEESTDNERSHLSALLFFIGILFPALLFLSIDIRPLEWDSEVLRKIRSISNPTLESSAVLLSQYGGIRASLWAGLPIALIAIARREFRHAYFIAFAIGGSAAINGVLKIVFSRARPNFLEAPIAELGFSYPSGHAMGSVALGSTIMLLSWHTRFRYIALAVCGVYIGAVALARLSLTVHYPTDIIAGWCIAFAWVVAIHQAIFQTDHLENSVNARMSGTPTLTASIAKDEAKP